MARRSRTLLNAGASAGKNTDPLRAYDHVNQNPVGQDGGPSVGLTDREPNVDSELSEPSSPRCTGMSASLPTDDAPEVCNDFSWALHMNPFAGPLLNAAQAVLEMFDGDIGISDDQFWPVVEARRICYGPVDGFVTAFNASTAASTEQQPVVDIDQLPYLLNPQDLAGLYRTTVSAIYARAERGQIPGRVKPTKKLLFHRDEIKKALDREAAGKWKKVP